MNLWTLIAGLMLFSGAFYAPDRLGSTRTPHWSEGIDRVLFR